MSPKMRCTRALIAVLMVLAGMVGLGGYAISEIYASRARLLLHPVNEGHFSLEDSARRHDDRTRIVVFGDSRVARWQPAPELSQAEWIWRGVRGETTAQMLYRFHSDVIDLQPRVVVIQAGVNDLVAGMAVGNPKGAITAALENLEEMIRRAQKASIQVVVLTVVRPAFPPVWRWLVWSPSAPALTDDLNAGIRRFASLGVRIIDADAILAEGASYLPSRYSVDTLHFADNAYEKINHDLVRNLRQMLDVVQ